MNVLEIYGDFGGILKQKLVETRICPSNQSRVDIQSQPSIDGQLLSSIDSEARKTRLGSQPTYRQSPTIITEIPLTDFNLIFMCSSIVLGNTRFLFFHIFTANIFRVLISLERKSKTPSELCIGTPVFQLYSTCASYLDYCYVLLCYV